MNPSLESVLQHPGIWRGNQRAQTAEDALPTGFAALDALLPGGGWPRGALTEVLLSRQGIGELRLLTPTLARLSEAAGWLAWVRPRLLSSRRALKSRLWKGVCFTSRILCSARSNGIQNPGGAKT